MIAFLARFARATAGNTLVVLAAFLIPLAALSGSAVDIGRLYLVKVRLQQACDAGALAGRKLMVNSNDATLDGNASAQAKAFFAANFPSGMMGTPAYATGTSPFRPVKTADKQVAGTASVRVPMTIMKMFGVAAKTVSVGCEARYDVADTDIMLVLDTTGSMSCATDEAACARASETYRRPDGTTGYSSAEKPTSRIVILRAAVMQFYDEISANKSSDTHIRYGIVPYSSSVNAGRALPRQYIANTWSYQSRRAYGDQNDPKHTWTDMNRYDNVHRTHCNTYRLPVLYPDRFGNTAWTYDSNGRALWRIVDNWIANYNGAEFGTCVIRNQPVVPLWRYQRWPADVSGFVDSLTTGRAVQDPSKVVPSFDLWQGCLEERQTNSSTWFDPKNLPADLDPDLIPYNDETRWKPMWPQQVYDRSGNDFYSLSQQYLPPEYPDDTYYRLVTNIGDPVVLARGDHACGKPVQRLAELSRSQLSDYIFAGDFRALGGTYHDIGMTWGTRLLSPTGIFAADTAAWPGRRPPNRIMIFMTDGEMAPGDGGYTMYGTERYDKRVTGGDLGSLKARHNARFLAACGAAKLRNITVIVIGFAQTLTPELIECASPGQAFYARDKAGLSAAFSKVANQVALLRMSK